MSWPIAIATGCCTQRPILEVLDVIEASGTTGIEFGTPPHHFDTSDRGQIDAVVARLHGSSLTPVSMHAPFGGPCELSDADPRRRHDAIAAVLTAARALKTLGGAVFVVHPTDVPRTPHDVESRLTHAAAALRVLATEVDTLGLTLAIESPLPHLVGGHPDEFAWLLHHVGLLARVCLDTGHTTLGGHWRRFLEISHDRLVHVHASDNHGQFDDHLPPGDGRIDWHVIRETLRQADYDGWIVLELACPDASLQARFAYARAGAERLLCTTEARQ